MSGDYLDEAAALMGWKEPAAIIEEPSSRRVMTGGNWSVEETAAWVKLSTAFKPHIKELKGAPLAVWLYLSLSINKTGVAFPSIKTMSEELDYSHQGIIDALRTLEDKGYLTIRRGEKRYNLYEPLFASIGKGNTPKEKESSPLDSTKLMSQVETPKESTFFPKESSPLDLNKSNKNQQETTATPVPERPEMFTTYEQEIGIITPAIARELQMLEGQYPKGWLTDAFKIASERNRRSLGYVRGILSRWKTEGRGDAPQKEEAPKEYKAPQPDPEDANRISYAEYMRLKGVNA